MYLENNPIFYASWLAGPSYPIYKQTSMLRIVQHS